MDDASGSSFRELIRAKASDLERLRQNALLDRSSLSRFSRELGFRTRSLGAIVGEDCLPIDGVDYDRGPLFHPFRVYVFLFLANHPSDESPALAEKRRKASEITDLACLLEPIYWPEITERIVLTDGIREEERDEAVRAHRHLVLPLLRGLDSTAWQKRRSTVISDAQALDNNRELYLVLRLSEWQHRQRLSGRVAGALWLRHIAEVIRRGFEEAHDEKWSEEDRAYSGDAKRRIFGTDRVFDVPTLSRGPVVRWFGLSHGSAVRWYVEGETEFYAISEMLTDPAFCGVELMNLTGKLKAGNTAVDLRQCLEEDRKHKRFSMISFDTDERSNVRAIRTMTAFVVGSVFASHPDFEFANFIASELADIAADLDETYGISAEKVRCMDLTGVKSMGAFDAKYKAASERRRSVKQPAEAWGRALGGYALKHPTKPDGQPRPVREAVSQAVLARSSNYDFDREHFQIDPDSFARVQRSDRPERS